MWNFLLCSIFVLEISAFPLIVKTTSGPVEGSEADGVISWKGIPYSRPPVGPYRWQPPVAPTPWSSVMPAKNFGAGCPQHCILPPHTCPPVTSEDCLSVNVFRPAGNATNLPVQVWIHGGKFEQGAGGCQLYDGSFSTKSTNHVIVTMNYRIGALGFLRIPEANITGNYGIMDQQLAMKWAFENVGAFGGNNQAILLYGQSAGGTSLAIHLATRSSWPYFTSAVVESNPWSLPLKTDKTNSGIDSRFVKDLHCSESDSSCLRSRSAVDIVAAQIEAQKHINIFEPLNLFYPWTPAVDGDFLAAQPLTLWQAGHIRPNTSIALGNVANETLMFIYMALPTTKPSEAEVEVVLGDIFGVTSTVEINKKYNIRMFPEDNRLGLSFLSNHYIMFCSNRAAAKAASKVGNKVFAYELNHVVSFSKVMWGPNYTFCDDYVCHGEELPLVWNTTSLDNLTFTPAEARLSGAMISSWANMVHGSPGGLWPEFSSNPAATGGSYWQWNTNHPMTAGQPIDNLHGTCVVFKALF